MKVVIILEDTTDGVYPIVSWEDNGVTDHVHQSLSMNLAAQLANAMRISSQAGALKVVEKRKDLH